MTSAALRLPRAHRWVRRMTTTVTATTAGGVLLLGSPVLTPGTATSGVHPTDEAATSGVHPTDEVVSLVSAERHRWPGHPDRAVLGHRVRPGDTATGLAVRFHAWTAELRAINHLGRHGRLYVGRRIRIPVVLSAVRHHHAKHRAKPHHLQARHPTQKARHQHAKPWRQAGASRAQVRRAVVRTARNHGVDPHAALAIAWQESGWQQRRTSSAGAVGTMQVMPGTGRWISLYVGRRLNIYGLHDNVVAGVLLFKVLRSQTSWRRSVAAYYQGLGSVRQHGMYPSTRRYTRSVAALYRRLHRGWNTA